MILTYNFFHIIHKNPIQHLCSFHSFKCEDWPKALPNEASSNKMLSPCDYVVRVRQLIYKKGLFVFPLSGDCFLRLWKVNGPLLTSKLKSWGWEKFETYHRTKCTSILLLYSHTHIAIFKEKKRNYISFFFFASFNVSKPNMFMWVYIHTHMFLYHCFFKHFYIFPQCSLVLIHFHHINRFGQIFP